MIIIDGTVGSGKSTLAEKVSEKLNIKMFEELNNSDTYELLERFYKDKERWSFTLQIHFLNERFRMIKDIHKNGGGILDRSIFGDRIFASMLNEDGYMTDEEFRTYSTLLDSMLEHTLPPSILIYIDCDLDTAIERINIRGREMELSVDREYWGRLNEKYKKWYMDYDLSEKISIGARSYHPDNDEDIDAIVEEILSKINPTPYVNYLNLERDSNGNKFSICDEEDNLWGGNTFLKAGTIRLNGNGNGNVNGYPGEN